MATVVFDIETNGLLPDLDRLHCLVLHEVESGRRLSCSDAPGHDGPRLQEGLEILREADRLVGHNILRFDLPALEKLGLLTFTGEIRDTLVCTRLLWPEIGKQDADAQKRKKPKRGVEPLPRNLTGSHSLKAWGFRLGVLKRDFADPSDTEAFASWTPEMQRYCEQDVAVTVELWRRIQEAEPPEEALILEHETAKLCGEIEDTGFPFDARAAGELYAKLSARRQEVDQELRQVFGGWWKREPTLTFPKTLRYKDKLRPDRIQGEQVTPIRRVDFNPCSRDHIANRLQVLHDWRPAEFTEGGKPKIDETILAGLDYPEAPLLAERFLLQKRIGQLAEGAAAWMRLDKAGRLHGRINPCGAVTGRATHFAPNIAQVPGGGAPYGAECRALFKPPEGWLLVGTDMSGLELRCLSHFMAPLDGGDYGRAVVEGDSKQGTDVHSLNAEALGFGPAQEILVKGKPMKGRDIAKRFIYAYLYGAGDEKLGSILGAGQTRGRKLRRDFQEKVPALAQLQTTVKSVAKRRGWLRGLDGRNLAVRSEHSGLNTLLQSAGALLCKAWMTKLRERLPTEGLTPGVDFQLHAWVHDELQLGVLPDIADEVGQYSIEAAKAAGERFDFAVPLTADYSIGASWAETH